MKRPQTNFHAHTTRESQAIRSKKSKFINRSKCRLCLNQTFLATQFFLFINILLKLQQQVLICFCKF